MPEASDEKAPDDDAAARAAVEGGAPGTVEPGGSHGKGPKPSDRLPPAGIHADPSLINEDATPGAGTLTPAGGHDDTDATSS
ncbi:MAG TPA: hypothetical protein VIL65_14650 [Beijerinckiaceae bacterium]